MLHTSVFAQRESLAEGDRAYQGAHRSPRNEMKSTRTLHSFSERAEPHPECFFSFFFFFFLDEAFVDRPLLSVAPLRLFWPGKSPTQKEQPDDCTGRLLFPCSWPRGSPSSRLISTLAHQGFQRPPFHMNVFWDCMLVFGGGLSRFLLDLLECLSFSPFSVIAVYGLPYDLPLSEKGCACL